MDRQHGDLASFIADVRAAVIEQYPSERDCFDTYANEAGFGFSIIEKDIKLLPQGAAVLEIGAGLLLLSGYLSRRGYRIHALEPIAAGFSHFQLLQDAVTAYYEKVGLRLSRIELPIENYTNNGYFDYVFSINVFEHIQDVERGLSNAYLSLKHQRGLRIYCPNYNFPYEPHFNIPTLINKRLTEFFLRSLIMNSSRVPEAKETWNGLNWINVAQVRRLFVNRFGIKPAFNRLATHQIIERMFADAKFSERRSRWMMAFLKVMTKVGATRLFKFTPITLSPVMDLYVERVSLSPKGKDEDKWLASIATPPGNGVEK
jgi:SAM-dependent methyltransferase